MEQRIETVEDLERILAEQAARVEAAFVSMAEGMLALAQGQKETAETVNQVIADRNSQLEIIGTLLQQVETLRAMGNRDHELLHKLAGIPPRPKGNPLAN